MQDRIATLSHLDPAILHARASDATKHCAGASWELAACLVAVDKSQAFRTLGCATVVEYAERRLGLGAMKTLELLRSGRVLERFPKLSQACREGRLCWSKLREIARAVTPDTEERWLDFAIRHSTHEVERAVTVSPRQFRQQQAERAAIERGDAGRPATERPVANCPTADGPVAGQPVGEAPAEKASTFTQQPVGYRESTASASCVSSALVPSAADAPAPPSRAPGDVASPPPGGPDPLSSSVHVKTSAAWDETAPPLPPQLVKVQLYLTTDQFALWDEALDRVRSAKSRHVSKEAALEALARHYLAGGSTRTRTNHPVVVRIDPGLGAAWYETSRGVLPASAEAVEDALARERGTFVEVRTVDRTEDPTQQTLPLEVAGAPCPILDPAPVAESSEQPPVQGPVAESSEQPPTQVTTESAERPSHADPKKRARGALARGASVRRGPRKPIPAVLRRAALARANYRCERCGATTGLQVDHIQPVCDGGMDLGNLQVLCRTCHAHKHAPDYAADPRYIKARAAGVARQKRAHGREREPDG